MPRATAPGCRSAAATTPIAPTATTTFADHCLALRMPAPFPSVHRCLRYPSPAGSDSQERARQEHPGHMRRHFRKGGRPHDNRVARP